MSDHSAQNAEIDAYNATFEANGWDGRFTRLANNMTAGISLGLIYDFDILGNFCFYGRIEAIMNDSGVNSSDGNTIEKVYYPTGELAAENFVQYTMFYSSIGIRKYWLGPWKDYFVNFFSGIDIGRVFGGKDMINIRRVVYDISGNITENTSEKATGWMWGICVESGLIIPSNFGVGFEIKGGYMISSGFIGQNMFLLDLSGYYVKFGMTIDFIENYRDKSKKKTAFDKQE